MEVTCVTVELATVIWSCVGYGLLLIYSSALLFTLDLADYLDVQGELIPVAAKWRLYFDQLDLFLHLRCIVTS